MPKTDKTGKNPGKAARKTVTARIKIEAAGSSLGAIRKFINSRMKRAGFSLKKISALKVAVTEHCENLIRHAYAGKGGKAELKLEIKYPRAKITVLDRGPKFDMRKKRIPDISRRLKNGQGGKMGIKTILALCDRVEYKRTGGCNENVFTVREKTDSGGFKQGFLKTRRHMPERKK
ncbi:MAG TPA: ATP-binding protein [bacterium]|nr:ATP-binding protein [bacterium]